MSVINSGRAHEPFLQACAREVAYLACKFDFEVHAVHIPGVDNRLPDWLSRAYIDSKYMDMFHSSTHNCFIEEVSAELFQFSYQW